MKKIIILSLFLLFSSGIIFAQHIKGLIVDAENKQPLTSANISIIGKHIGTVSNSEGKFKLDLDGVSESDSIAFTFIGYETQYFAVAELDLDSSLTIQLTRSLIDLNTVTVFAIPLTAKEILNKMLENKEKNYSLPSYKARVFRRNVSLFVNNNSKVILKKSTIPVFTYQVIEKINHTFGDTTLYVVDKLFDLYFREDSSKKKDLKWVEQQVEGISDLNQLGNKILQQLGEVTRDSDKTYWKVNSGILFSKKINITESENDSTSMDESANFDLIGYINEMIWNQDFMTKLGKYDYELEGCVDLNGELAYILHFSPDGGKKEGRMYVSTDTYALLKIDYEKHISKNGDGVSMFGFSYKNKQDGGLAVFQKYKDGYHLKYARKTGQNYLRVKRPLTLTAKKKRFLFDKTIETIEFEVILDLLQNSCVEYLITDLSIISNDEYNLAPPNVNIKPIKVQHYDDPSIWKDYSIIEPTQLMKQYRGND